MVRRGDKVWQLGVVVSHEEVSVQVCVRACGWVWETVSWRACGCVYGCVCACVWRACRLTAAYSTAEAKVCGALGNGQTHQVTA